MLMCGGRWTRQNGCNGGLSNELGRVRWYTTTTPACEGYGLRAKVSAAIERLSGNQISSWPREPSPTLQAKKWFDVARNIAATWAPAVSQRAVPKALGGSPANSCGVDIPQTWRHECHNLCEKRPNSYTFAKLWPGATRSMVA